MAEGHLKHRRVPSADAEPGPLISNNYISLIERALRRVPPSHPSTILRRMDADDIFAAMGISGFGKATRKRELDPNRFDKAKRDAVSAQRLHGPTRADPQGNQKDESATPSIGPSTPGIVQPRSDTRASPDGSEPEPGPQPSANQNQEEPEYDPSEDEDDIEGDFPTTHELIMKDHTKVVTALGMDPSGARVVSGSHDYDCKLWDFGGMTQECKPFKSWEPAGSYPVCTILSLR